MKQNEFSIVFARKVFDLAGVELVCPTSSNLEGLTREELVENYDKAWNALMDIHHLAHCFKDCVETLESLGFSAVLDESTDEEGEKC